MIGLNTETALEAGADKELDEEGSQAAMKNSSHVWHLLSYAAAVVLIWVGLFLFMRLMARSAKGGRPKGKIKGGKNRQQRRQELGMKKGSRRY